jgi:hypothetical protein
MRNMMTEIDPNNDGIDHIWLSSEANTELGRQLYIGAKRPFVDPKWGQFDSVYAFWVWYDGGKLDSLRSLHHDNMIRSSLAGMNSSPGGWSEVVEVLKRSVIQDPRLNQMLVESTLPFAVYDKLHFQGRTEPAVYPLNDREWYVRALENLRQELQTA